jgi:hypothetical protein
MRTMGRTGASQLVPIAAQADPAYLVSPQIGVATAAPALLGVTRAIVKLQESKLR